MGHLAQQGCRSLSEAHHQQGQQPPQRFTREVRVRFRRGRSQAGSRSDFKDVALKRQIEGFKCDEIRPDGP